MLAIFYVATPTEHVSTEHGGSGKMRHRVKVIALFRVFMHKDPPGMSAPFFIKTLDWYQTPVNIWAQMVIN